MDLLSAFCCLSDDLITYHSQQTISNLIADLNTSLYYPIAIYLLQIINIYEENRRSYPQ